MVHGNNGESHMWGFDSGNTEEGTHAESMESVPLLNNFLFSACYVSASMSHKENTSTAGVLLGEESEWNGVKY